MAGRTGWRLLTPTTCSELLHAGNRLVAFAERVTAPRSWRLPKQVCGSMLVVQSVARATGARR